MDVSHLTTHALIGYRLSVASHKNTSSILIHFTTFHFGGAGCWTMRSSLWTLLSLLLFLSSHMTTHAWNHRRVLGVCGGIGSGKSSACQSLVSQIPHAVHLDADVLAHAVYAPQSPVLREIVEAFGQEDLLLEDGSLNRPKLGSLVFGDPSALRQLERLVWPHVKALLQAKLDDDHRDAPLVVIEAAVLLDANWLDLLDGLWVVRVPRPIALHRLVEDRGLPLEQAEQRLDAQESRRGMGNLEEELRAGTVTAVIDNAGSLEDLREALRTTLEDEKAWYVKESAPL